MINVSDEFKELMYERTNFKENAVVTFSDGTVLELAAEDFTVSNNAVSDAAGVNSIPLGVAISRSIQIELMNDDDHLRDYDFFGAKVRLYLTFQLSETTEKIEYGTFTVTSPETYGSTVIISANDDMHKADKGYSTNLAFPATIKDMLIDSCEICDIPLLSTSFPNDDFVVAQKPSSDYTHRQIIGYIAMLAGGNARVNRQGNLEILSYSPDYAAADPHQLTEWKNLKVDTDDITITGVQTIYAKEVTMTDGDGNTTTERQDMTVLEGEKGYVLSISNPLIAGAEQTVVSLIGEFLVGMSFRKFEGDHIAYPIAEFMDPVEVTDRKGNVYQSFLTDINFVFFGFTTMKNSAESGVRNSSKYSSNPTAALIEAKKLIRAEQTARETAVEKLATTIANKNGLYMTTEEMEDGSLIYYAHNKPTIEESDIIWLMTAEAIGISTDGGETYPYGFVVDGELITRILQTEGVNADWILAGVIKSKDGKSIVIDLDNGNVNLTGNITTQEEQDSTDSTIKNQSSFTPYGIAIRSVNADSSKTLYRVWIQKDRILLYNASNGESLVISTYGGKNVISGLSAPTNDSDAANKDYVNQMTTRSIHSAYNTSSSGYIQIAQITITGTYCDQELYFELVRRSTYRTKVYLRFANVSNTTPSYSTFEVEGHGGVYLYNVGNGVWNLYVQKSTGYDTIDVVDFKIGNYTHSRVNVEWTNVLVTSLPSGYVSPTNRDYVIAQGTSGIWTYRKWNSGVAECWGTTAATTGNTSAWGSLYVVDDIVTSQTYPFSFTEVPKVVATYKRYSSGNDGWLYSGSVISTKSASPSFGFARCTSGSISVQAELYAIGKWK